MEQALTATDLNRTCGWCGSEYVTERHHHDSGFCSGECRRKSIRTGGLTKTEWIRKNGLEEISEDLYRKTCKWCGKSFEIHSSHAFASCCSDECAVKYRHHRMSKDEWLKEKCVIADLGNGTYGKRCVWCLKDFGTTNPNKKCCSIKCQKNYAAHSGINKYEWDVYLAKKAMRKKRELERRECLRNAPVYNVCKFCGKSFEAGKRGQMFCSVLCGKLHARHNCEKEEFLNRFNLTATETDGIYEKTCQYCGKTFRTKNILQRSCSTTCNKYFAKHGRVSKKQHREDVEKRRIARENGIIANGTAANGTHSVAMSTSEMKRNVERVLSLTPDKIYKFSKDWTDEERAYAKKIGKGGVGCVNLSGSKIKLDVDDLDEADIEESIANEFE